MIHAQESFAAYDLVTSKIDDRLIVQLESAFRDGLTDIQFQCAARSNASIHLRLKEAVCPAPVGFGAIHRQIGTFQQLIELGAVIRSQRNTYAGVCRDLMTKTLMWFADSLVNSLDELHDVARLLYACLDDCKFVASKSSNEIRLSDTTPQTGCHGFQEFIACGMAERIVDALEFVDVDVEHRKLLAPLGSLELPLQLLAERHAIRQIGQRVVVSQMGNLLLGAPALRDVLLRGNPSTIRQRSIHDLDRTTVGGFQDAVGRPFLRNVPQHRGTELVDITRERTGFFPMRDEIAEMTARLYHVRRQIIHFQITLVAQNNP